MKCDNVDDALQLWQCMFNDVINKHIPKKSKCVRAAPSPWLNNDIFKHMSKCDYLHIKAIRSNDTSDWNAYNLYRNKVTTMIRKSKETYFKVAGHMSQTGLKKCFIPQNCRKYTNFD